MNLSPARRTAAFSVLCGVLLAACGGADTASNSDTAPAQTDTSGATGAEPWQTDWTTLPAIPPAETLDAAAPDALVPVVVTDAVLNDSDDPAIWINPGDPARSLIVGTDKGDSIGGLYVFDLDGRLDSARTRIPLARMNNVDIAYGLQVDGRATDIAVGTERNRQRIRVFSLPDMRPIDDGGIEVFDGDTTRAPMGIALYTRPSDGAIFAVVGGKSGPTEGYLWQYQLTDDGTGTVRGEVVRRFGRYSGAKEIEALVVDNTLGHIFYADETVGIRKYHADPAHPDAERELALFATTGFARDHEGLAIYPATDSTGFLVASDQQGRRIQLFPREGSAGNPHLHAAVATIPVTARQTDGVEVTARALGDRFPKGVLVMMSDNRTFHVYDWRDVEGRVGRE